VEIGLAIDAGKRVGDPLYQSFSGLLSRSFRHEFGCRRGCRFRTDLFVSPPVYFLAYLRAVVGSFTSLASIEVGVFGSCLPASLAAQRFDWHIEIGRVARGVLGRVLNRSRQKATVDRNAGGDFADDETDRDGTTRSPVNELLDIYKYLIIEE
jgi:hypothetical protein